MQLSREDFIRQIEAEGFIPCEGKRLYCKPHAIPTEGSPESWTICGNTAYHRNAKCCFIFDKTVTFQ